MCICRFISVCVMFEYVYCWVGVCVGVGYGL